MIKGKVILRSGPKLDLPAKDLKLFDEEFLSRQKSRDRQGVLELVEVLLGMRRTTEGREE